MSPVALPPLTNSRANPLRTLHYSIVGYVLLLCLSAVTASGVVKALANATAIGIFAIALTNWLFYRPKSLASPSQILCLGFFYIGISGSLLFSFNGEELADALKIAIAPFFFIIGTDLSDELEKWSFKDGSARLLFGALVFLPMLPIAFQLATGSLDLSSSKQIGFFANRNNAGLYAIALLCFYGVLSRDPLRNPFIYLGVGLMFGTLGLFLAVALALIFSHGKIRYIVIGLVTAIVGLFILSLLPEFSAKLRVKPVMDSIALLLSGRIDLETVSYADLVLLLNTQDLSFIFRLKHWYNLFNIYIHGSLLELFFGFGAGSSVNLSAIRLVPHNDYVRLIFEFGIISFTGFICLMAFMIRSIQRGWTLVPFLAVVIYFFSENLINNYPAMVLFFLSAGVLSTRNLSTSRVH